MSTVGKVIGSVSVAGGLVGAAVLGGVTAQRRALRRYREWDEAAAPGAGDFDALPSDRSYSVAAPDGVALHVEEVGALDAPLTVVFSHGWTLRSGAWHFQRLGLAGPDFGPDPAPAPDHPGAGSAAHPDVPRRRGSGSTARHPDSGIAAHLDSGTAASDRRTAPALRDHPRARLVFYDQRSHGRSSRAAPGHATIGDLARDLAAVIATAAPAGPLVLVGHSMGGMAVMALAGQDPDLMAARVAGVALLSTSAGEGGGGARRWLQVNGANPLLPVVAAAASRYPGAFERGRAAGRDVIWLLTRSLGFADPHVPAPLVDYLDQMISATPMEVIAEFAPALFSHDQSAALPALSGIPALIAVGAQDRMTPPSRTADIAAALPHAEVLIVPNAGHMAIMEAPDVINDALRRLLRAAWRHARRSGGPATSTTALEGP